MWRWKKKRFVVILLLLVLFFSSSPVEITNSDLFGCLQTTKKTGAKCQQKENKMNNRWISGGGWSNSGGIFFFFCQVCSARETTRRSFVVFDTERMKEREKEKNDGRKCSKVCVFFVGDYLEFDTSSKFSTRSKMTMTDDERIDDRRRETYRERHHHPLARWSFLIDLRQLDQHVHHLCVVHLHRPNWNPWSYPFETWSSVTFLVTLEEKKTMGNFRTNGDELFVSAEPLMENVFEPREAWTLGLAKWITSPLSLNILTCRSRRRRVQRRWERERHRTNLFDALDVVCGEFFQRALKFLVIHVGLSMNDFLLSTSCALKENDVTKRRGKEEEFRRRTLPPILIALALSASSFNFFWLTWNTGVASVDVVFWSEDMKINLIFRLKKNHKKEFYGYLLSSSSGRVETEEEGEGGEELYCKETRWTKHYCCSNESMKAQGRNERNSSIWHCFRLSSTRCCRSDLQRAFGFTLKKTTCRLGGLSEEWRWNFFA